MRFGGSVASLLAALVLAGTAAAESGHAGYPSSIAVLGDSDSTGYNSAIPARDAKANSWLTGTNPAVDSIYLRLLALDPKIRGRNANWATDGAKAVDMVGQAQAALSTHPELVVLALATNDFCGDDDTPVPIFRSQITRALAVLSRGLPNARLFVVSVPYTGESFYGALAPIPAARAATEGTGPCDPNWDASGNPDLQHLAHIDQLEGLYNAARAAACAQFIHCRYDGGALTKITGDASDFSSDWGHPSVSGLAKFAAAVWPSLFDFSDMTAPTSAAAVRHMHGARIVTLTAHDDAGVAGIEYKLGRNNAWLRYHSPVHLSPKTGLTWRAVDVNGNIEATHTLKPNR
jgi:lysophospholipase L1-like esterase